MGSDLIIAASRLLGSHVSWSSHDRTGLCQTNQVVEL
jgi:hypothetical protein